MDFSKRQIEIIQAATKLVGEKGIQNLTTKNLAAEMGFSEPALYRHFKNKTEILVSVLNFYRSELQKSLKDIFSSNTTGREKLKQIMKIQFGHFSENPAIVMVIFSETSFQYEKQLSEVVLKILNNKREKIEMISKKGQMDGSIRNDIEEHDLASLFMGGMRFTILRWRLNDYKYDLIEEGNHLWTTFELLIKQN